MHFDEILDQAIAMLQRRGRVTYRALKRQFNLDDAFLEDLTVELIKGQRLARDEDGAVLVWTGVPAPPAAPAPTPLASTPPYLVAKILTTRSAMEGERKQVTVLFADLKGSTELIRDLDPEAAQKLLDPALQRMMDAVHRFEGTVNQVLGDGIMALFGAPIAHEDHALRACYAALAMQAELRRYAEEVRHTQGLEVQLRVGLNSGDVVVRTIGNDLHMDYSAVGQTTHLAARMEQLALPGTIRLPAATLRLVEGLVRVTALGPIPVKGLAAPVEVFELLGATPVRRRLQAAVARRVADAVVLLTQTLEQTMATEMLGYQALCTLPLGEALLLAGRLEEAHALAERTLALARERQERGNQAYALRLLGDIAARREPPESESAEAHYRQALALAEELGMRPLQAHCHLGLGMLYVQTGRPEPARVALTTAITLYRAMDMTFWLPQAEAPLAQVS